jgi:hypothetical protein
MHYSSHSLTPYSSTLDSVTADIKWCETKNRNLATLKCLYVGKSATVSKTMAEKIAGSGLVYGHMKCAYDRSGSEGLIQILSSKRSGGVRVTNRKSILEKIVGHFAK